MKTQIRRQFVIAKRPMVLLLTLGLLAAGGLIAPPAHAATRGTNGQIAYATGGPNSANSQIFVKNADGSGLPRPLTPAAGYSEPTWSPDGTMIAVIAAVGPSRGIVLFPAKGGFPIGTLDADPNDREPAWSPPASGRPGDQGRSACTPSRTSSS